MNQQFKDTIIILATISVLLCSFLIPLTIYNFKSSELESKTIIELVSKGVDPIAARCAISTGNDQLCVLYVVEKRVAK